MSGDVGLDELVMRLRRMMRTSAKHTVIVIRYSKFAFIRDDARQRLVQVNGVKELAAHYGAECLIVGGLDAVVIFPDGKAIPASEMADRITANIFPDRREDDPDGETVATTFKIPSEYTALRAIVADFQDEAAAEVVPVAVVDRPLEGPLTPALLGRLIDMLADADVRRFVRPGKVFQCGPGGERRIEYVPFGIDAGALQAELFPKVDLGGRRHLTLELRSQLDLGLLSAVAARRAELGGYQIGVGIAPRTVLGAMYPVFARSLAEAKIGGVTVELPARAMLEDLSVAARAVAAARGFGHRVCIDDVPVEMLPFLRLEAFGADYYKIAAGREQFAQFADSNIVGALRRLGRNAILHVGANGVSVGQALGVGLFQEETAEDRQKAA